MGPSLAGWLDVMSFQIYLDAESVLLPVYAPWTPPRAPNFALTIDSQEVLRQVGVMRAEIKEHSKHNNHFMKKNQSELNGLADSAAESESIADSV